MWFRWDRGWIWCPPLANHWLFLFGRLPSERANPYPLYHLQNSTKNAYEPITYKYDRSNVLQLITQYVRTVGERFSNRTYANVIRQLDRTACILLSCILNPDADAEN